jgi:hypothetical protein
MQRERPKLRLIFGSCSRRNLAGKMSGQKPGMRRGLNTANMSKKFGWRTDHGDHPITRDHPIVSIV